MPAYKRRHVLPSAAWVDGGNIQIPVKDLPPLSRIEAIVIRLEAVFNTGGAAALIPSTQLERLIQMIDLGPNCRGSGVFFRAMQTLMRGGECALPAAIPATNSSAFRRHLSWTIPYYDARKASPADECPVGADLNDRVLSIDTAAALSLGAGTWSTLTSVTGTLRVEALLLPPNDKPGAVVQFGYADLTGQAPTIGGTALYEDVFLFRESKATISSAEVTTVAVAIDGNQYHDQVRLSEYAQRFNDLYAKGSQPQTSSATAPIGLEFIPDTPAYTAGVADTVTVPGPLPLLYPMPDFKLADLPVAEQTLRLDFTGSDSSFRVGYRRVLPHTEASLIGAFQRQGQPVSSLSQVASDTKNGNAVGGRRAGLGRFLPAARKG